MTDEEKTEWVHAFVYDPEKETCYSKFHSQPLYCSLTPVEYEERDIEDTNTRPKFVQTCQECFFETYPADPV